MDIITEKTRFFPSWISRLWQQPKTTVGSTTVHHYWCARTNQTETVTISFLLLLLSRHFVVRSRCVCVCVSVTESVCVEATMPFVSFCLLCPSHICIPFLRYKIFSLRFDRFGYVMRRPLHTYVCDFGWFLYYYYYYFFVRCCAYYLTTAPIWYRTH